MRRSPQDDRILPATRIRSPRSALYRALTGDHEPRARGLIRGCWSGSSRLLTPSAVGSVLHGVNDGVAGAVDRQRKVAEPRRRPVVHTVDEQVPDVPAPDDVGEGTPIGLLEDGLVEGEALGEGHLAP